MFDSLDFVYVPTADVAAAADRYVQTLAADLVRPGADDHFAGRIDD